MVSAHFPDVIDCIITEYCKPSKIGKQLIYEATIDGHFCICLVPSIPIGAKVIAFLENHYIPQYTNQGEIILDIIAYPCKNQANVSYCGVLFWSGLYVSWVLDTHDDYSPNTHGGQLAIMKPLNNIYKVYTLSNNDFPATIVANDGSIIIPEVIIESLSQNSLRLLTHRPIQNLTIKKCYTKLI